MIENDTRYTMLFIKMPSTQAERDEMIRQLDNSYERGIPFPDEDAKESVLDFIRLCLRGIEQGGTCAGHRGVDINDGQAVANRGWCQCSQLTGNYALISVSLQHAVYVMETPFTFGERHRIERHFRAWSHAQKFMYYGGYNDFA